MDKSAIISEVIRISKIINRTPGQLLFTRLSGINQSEWKGIHWTKWNKLIREAGLLENKLKQKTDEDFILLNILKLIEKIGKYPTYYEVKMERKINKSFPSFDTVRRIGCKNEVLDKLINYIAKTKTFTELISTLKSSYLKNTKIDNASNAKLNHGYVYLGCMEIGKEKRYKIGRTNLVERRFNELNINSPENIALIHAIKTDDIVGIEKYWHDRFLGKKTKGEWFNLSLEDVKCFKLKKVM